jgi:hypothetical protein
LDGFRARHADESQALAWPAKIEERERPGPARVDAGLKRDDADIRSL